MRIILVSARFPDITQQIHSLRASGVISSHNVCTALFEAMAFRKSVGTLCVTPVASLWRACRKILVIFALYHFTFRVSGLHSLLRYQRTNTHEHSENSKPVRIFIHCHDLGMKCGPLGKKICAQKQTHDDSNEGLRIARTIMP